ncbi:MAG: hypothetical protein HLUCCA08_15720 [Rhodobacteraceae bacterium HLUCCA08]|nr:MAG: hypothetical protein HLUCCA08_15720 [Rhodobacteraceae bacterium HLUCCA08]
MPAATNKTDLSRVTAVEFGKLAALIAPIPAPQAMRKRAEESSIKDVIAHRAHWIDLFLGWHAQGLSGAPVAIPAPGYRWTDLKRYNADLRAAQAGIGWDAARAMLQDAHDRLTGFIEGLDETALYGGPMQGGGNAWTTGRWAEAAGPSHYRSAAKWIRACLRADAG